LKHLAIVVGAYVVAMTLWIYLWAAPYWEGGETFTGIDDFAFAVGILIHVATGFAAGRPLILLLALAPPLLALPFNEDCADQWLCISLAYVALYGGIVIGLPSLALGLAIRWVWRRRSSTRDKDA
jgi:hypothetical protein